MSDDEMVAIPVVVLDGEDGEAVREAFRVLWDLGVRVGPEVVCSAAGNYIAACAAGSLRNRQGTLKNLRRAARAMLDRYMKAHMSGAELQGRVR